jgi:hypothetical protein
MVWTAEVHRHVVRRGRVAWLTHPPSGTGRVESESRAFGVMPVTRPKGNPVRAQAAPGELLAVARAMFMAAAMSEALALVGSPPNEIVVGAARTFAGSLPNRDLVELAPDVSGRVPGLDAAGFRQAVESSGRRSLRSAGVRDDMPCEPQRRLGEAS